MAAFTAEDGETLATLAALFKVDAKLLASINPLLDTINSLDSFDQVNNPADHLDLSTLEPAVKKKTRSTRPHPASVSRSLASEEEALLMDLAPDILEDERTAPGWSEVALEKMTGMAKQDPAQGPALPTLFDEYQHEID